MYIINSYSISVTMMSRLMLNLHREAGVVPEVRTVSSDTTSPNTTTMLFTSRLTVSTPRETRNGIETGTQTRITATNVGESYGSSNTASDYTRVQEIEEIELSPVSR